MDTIVAKITNDSLTDKKIYEQAGKILREGGLVAFPTETVYGLGADALDEEASAKIYAAKGRPSDNPLIVHIADIEALYKLSCEVPDKALKLADKFWPGPLTMILKKSDIVPDSITGGLGTVAIRMPSHKVAAELIRTSGVYIAAPSANTSGKPSPTRASHVIKDLSGKIDMIIEDDTIISKELYELLVNAGYEALILKDFSNAKEEILKSNIDLILLDINIPYQNGEQLLKEIRKESNIPVIMVTSRASETDEILSISYGADDYITKPYSPTILLLRIQNIFKRLDNSAEILKYKDLEVSPSRGTLSGNNKELELTKNEMLIFQHLLNNQNRIVSRDELMTILWNNEEYINDNALTVNISRLRSKLEDFGYPNAIETRKGQGYILL